LKTVKGLTNVGIDLYLGCCILVFIWYQNQWLL